MFAKVSSLGLFGLNAFPVDVEINLSQGLPRFEIVGLADAAVQFDTRVVNLEYEVVERGFDGFKRKEKKPWFLKVYQNPDTIKKTVVGKNGETVDAEDEEFEEKIVSKNGEYFLHHFGLDIMLKVTKSICPITSIIIFI